DFTTYLPGTAVVDGSQITASTMNQYDGALTLQHAATANFDTIYIGFFDTNLAEITLDASTMVAANVVVGPYSSENNQLIVTNGSLLTVINSSSSGTLEMSYGTLEFDGGTIFADNLKSARTNAAINFSGGLMDCGSANISNSLPFVVGNGIAEAEYHLHGGTHSFADGLHISANASLTGNGTVIGAVTVATGGTLSPGNSIGGITLGNSPTLQGNVTLEISKTGMTLTNDQLKVMAPLTYGGTLTVSNAGPNALAAGDSFQMFSASNYDGSFTSLYLPPLNSGLTWTNQLLVDGSIAVIAQPIPAIHLTTSSGSNLIFSVTNGSPGGAYDLLTSTNLALPLSSWITNRSGNFDSSGNQVLTNSISPNEPQRFFLLKTP
ncbi:MAG TPA: hypothetical protein VFF11_01075, partial [Candidatus Binatia bacterium]|nr:hypothetical protein [Candidatus Binatia bacterium]